VALRLAVGAKMVAAMVVAMVRLPVAIPMGRLLPAGIPLLVGDEDRRRV